MNIGNPLNSIPRYAKLFTSGIQGKPAPIPHINTQGSGKIDNAVYNTSLYTNQHPYQALGATIGGVVVNNILGNPLGGFIDTVTFGRTDFDKQNLSLEPPSVEIRMAPKQQTYDNRGLSYFPEQIQFAQIPQLNEQERKRQLEYLQRKAATDLITIQALQQQPGMEVYQ